MLFLEVTKPVFDLTFFPDDAEGAVIEFRNADEYTEFVNFFNEQENVEKIYINYQSKFNGGNPFCVRIFRRSHDQIYRWCYGPSRASYETEYKVVNLEDIRIGSADLGEITSDEISLESVFFA